MSSVAAANNSNPMLSARRSITTSYVCYTARRLLPCTTVCLLFASFAAVYFALVFPRLVALINNSSSSSSSDQYLWLIVLAVQLLLFAATALNYFISMCRDPGRLPNNPNRMLHATSSADPGPISVIVLGAQIVDLKWCQVSLTKSSE